MSIANYYNFKFFNQFSIIFLELRISFLDIVRPSSMILAFGSNYFIFSIVPENLLPPCVEKGIIILLEKLYSSKKLYIAIGRS